MKNKFLFFLLAAIIVFTGRIKIYPQSCNCLPGWQYKMTITISNNNAGAYSNFEVKVVMNTQQLISAGKMKADGGDIRFRDSLCNSLNYFVESGINTSSTVIWVNIPSLPASSIRNIDIYYGNPSASSGSSGPNTFTFYEGFDNNNLGRFGTGPVCSSGTPNVSFNGGLATFTWTASAIWLSDSSFAPSNVLTAEAKVTSANGNFPGVYWARSIGTQSMAVLMGNSNVNISKAPISAPNNCVGHIFIPPTYPVSNPVGIWGFTWVSTGSQSASFPSVGTWITSDNELPKDQPLRIGLGGVSSGSGSYTIDWVRARKYAFNQPSAATGSEISTPASPGNSCTAVVLNYSSIRVTWNDNAINEEMYKIERSTNSGTNWILRDSAGANTTAYVDYGLQPETGYCYRVYAANCFGVSGYSNMACSTTTAIGIIKNSSEIPKEYRLYQNYPNPFNPVTKIRFDIPLPGGVDAERRRVYDSFESKTRGGAFTRLAIYDILGKEIIVLVNELLTPGTYEVDWDGTDYPSGIYFYRLESGDYVNNMKMVLLK